jgi:hypothetical protein
MRENMCYKNLQFRLSGSQILADRSCILAICYIEKGQKRGKFGFFIAVGTLPDWHNTDPGSKGREGSETCLKT